MGLQSDVPQEPINLFPMRPDPVFLSHDCAESGRQSPRQGRGLIAVVLREGRSHGAPGQWVSAETFTSLNDHLSLQK